MTISVHRRPSQLTQHTNEPVLPQHTSGNKKAEEEAAKEAERRVEEIKRLGKESGDKVVEDLLKIIMDVKPEVPDRVAAPPKA